MYLKACVYIERDIVSSAWSNSGQLFFNFLTRECVDEHVINVTNDDHASCSRPMVFLECVN